LAFDYPPVLGCRLSHDPKLWSPFSPRDSAKRFWLLNQLNTFYQKVIQPKRLSCNNVRYEVFEFTVNVYWELWK
jgi:hypothetical protein